MSRQKNAELYSGGYIMRQIIENKSKSDYYHYNLYQAYYNVPEEEHHPLFAHHTEAENGSSSRRHLDSLSNGERTIILHRISAELGYPETETEIKKELWS